MVNDSRNNDSTGSRYSDTSRRKFIQTVGATGWLLGASGLVSGENARRWPPRGSCNGIVQSHLAGMTDREKIGQMLLTDPFTGDASPVENDRKAIQHLHIGTIGGPNTTRENAERTATFANTVQKIATEAGPGIPLLINADMEYGVGQKLDTATEFPQQMGIGATRSTDHATDAARITAREARAMGIHWNNSPVADVNTNSDNPIIGWRSFGERTALCSDLILPQIHGYQSNGVIASPKHFPGHGDTSTDSHTGLPAVTYDRETLEETHLPPFQAAFDAGADALMTAHIIVEAVDSELPATLSRPVLTDLLRDQMGFDGVVVTDSMTMDAITDRWGDEEAALLAAQAGADVLMIRSSYEVLEGIADTLYEALQSGDLSRERVEESARRVLALKCKYGIGIRPNQDPFVEPETATNIAGHDEHQNKSHEIAQDSITLVENDGSLPLSRDSASTTLVTGIWDKQISETVERSSNDTVTRVEPENAVEHAPEADRIIVSSDGNSDLINSLQSTSTPVIAIESGMPYDIAEYAGVNAALAVYNTVFPWAREDNHGTIEAAVECIFGVDPQGKLPVTIDDRHPYGHGLSY